MGSRLVEMIIPINSCQLLSFLVHFITASGNIRNILLNLSLLYAIMLNSMQLTACSIYVGVKPLLTKPSAAIPSDPNQLEQYSE